MSVALLDSAAGWVAAISTCGLLVVAVAELVHDRRRANEDAEYRSLVGRLLTQVDDLQATVARLMLGERGSDQPFEGADERVREEPSLPCLDDLNAMQARLLRRQSNLIDASDDGREESWLSCLDDLNAMQARLLRRQSSLIEPTHDGQPDESEAPDLTFTFLDGDWSVDWTRNAGLLSLPIIKDTFDKTPRNAPCTCGSEKKFKSCHGRA